MTTVSLSWQTGHYQSVNQLLRHNVLFIVIPCLRLFLKTARLISSNSRQQYWPCDQCDRRYISVWGQGVLCHVESNAIAEVMHSLSKLNTVNPLHSGHCKDLELASSWRESVIKDVYFSQTSVIHFCLGFSYCPFYRGVRKARVEFS